ncbi:MAG: heavy metal translocating P-type ATPase, partial [Oscillospiraceae bacterium]
MKQKFHVDGMSCSACSATVQKLAEHIKGVKKAEVNLLTKSMMCEFDSRKTSELDIIKAVEQAGFSAYTWKDTQKSKPEKFTNIKTRLIISICFLVPLMYISMGHMLSLPFTNLLHDPQNAIFFSLTQFILTLPVLYVNRKFFFVGFKSLINRSPNMDTLVAVGSSAAVIYGIFAIYMIGYGLGTGNIQTVKNYMTNLYFESAAMILTLVTVGKFLEERAGRKTNGAIRKLLDLSPKKAVVIRDGIQIEIDVSNIIIDDILIIKPGDQIPVDGVVEEGCSSLDTSALTGESIPIDKTVGDNVMSASININGFLKIKATKVGKDTTLARIIALVENASSSKPPIARLADKI